MTRTTAHNQTLGAHGESIAAAYLEAHGFHVLDRNWRNRYGELDIIALEGSPPDDALVAVEVKTRTGPGYGHPISAITARKVKRLKRLLLDWRRAQDTRASELRVDAIGITFHPGGTPNIDHFRGIS